MKTGEKGIELIKSFEGCRLTGYLCPAKVPTIGYGHTGTVDGKAVCVGMKITKAKAIELLKEDLEKFEKKVNKYSKYKWTQNEFDALVSFAYNIGSIDKLTADGTRSKMVISEKLLAYNKAGVKVLSGLTRRRKAEQALFLTK
jgi:GH24 family phage-related lysozyme (muramidase)